MIPQMQTHRPPKGRDDFWLFLRLLGNPDEFKQRAREIDADIERANEIISRVGKLADVDRLHKEAVRDRQVAIAELADHRRAAAEIVSKAQSQLKAVEDARAAVAADRAKAEARNVTADAKLKQAREDQRAAEAAAELAKQELAAAEKMRADAERVRTTFEAKNRELEQTLARLRTS